MTKLLDFDESIFATIIHSQHYFDTVVFRLSRDACTLNFLDSALVRELAEINAPGSVTFVESPLYYSKPPWSNFLLDIKQPKRDTLLYLKKRVWSPLLIKRVDLALDHVFDSQEEANRFALFQAQSLIQRRNPELIDSYDETVYSKQKKRREGRKSPPDRVHVIYNDRGARNYHGAPCCHQEIRYTTAASVQRQGISTIDDLLQFDFRKFFEKELCLVWLRENAIDRLTRKMLGISKRKKEVSYERVYNLGKKTITVDLFRRYRSRLLEHSTAWVGKQKLISAHNLKCISNQVFDHGRDDNHDNRDNRNRIRRGVFEVGMFEQIPLEKLLKGENLMEEGIREQGSWK